MNNYTIAIIDSGSCLDDPYIFYANIVNLDSNGLRIGSDGLNMHGTYVARLINRETQCALHILSIKILDENNKGRIKELCKALKICIDEQVKIINISLGIPECYGIQLCEFIELCKLAKKQGIIIVSAYHNNGINTYPALLPYVIGVYTSSNQQVPVCIDRYTRNISFSHNYIISFEQPSYLIKGNSYLAPIITGLLYMFLMNYGLDVDDFLYYLSIEWKPCLQKKYWINNFDDIKNFIRNKKVTFFTNIDSKTNTELLSFLLKGKGEDSVRCVFDLNISTYMYDEIVFIGDLNLSEKLSIGNMYDFTYKLASSGKDIIMLSSYISIWDRINITQKCNNKLISLYF